MVMLCKISNRAGTEPPALAFTFDALDQRGRESEYRSTGMGLFSKDIKSMEDLFLHTLQDVYYAENQIVKSLPKMIEKATNRELATGLRNREPGEPPRAGL